MCCQIGESGFGAALTCGAGGPLASKCIVIRCSSSGAPGSVLKIPGLRGAGLHVVVKPLSVSVCVVVCVMSSALGLFPYFMLVYLAQQLLVVGPAFAWLLALDNACH